MPKSRGERAQDYNARKAFEGVRREATALYRERLEQGLVKEVLVEVACPCSYLPYAHHHSAEDKKRELMRFDYYWEKGKRKA